MLDLNLKNGRFWLKFETFGKIIIETFQMLPSQFSITNKQKNQNFRRISLNYDSKKLELKNIFQCCDCEEMFSSYDLHSHMLLHCNNEKSEKPKFSVMLHNLGKHCLLLNKYFMIHFSIM